MFHGLLSSRDTKWKANDLNDIMYLTCAAAYADYIVCEKHLAHQIRQASRAIPRAAIDPFTKVTALVETIG